jgi:hypothetical protein
MWCTESPNLRVCCRYICKKLKPFWPWSLPQFSALAQTDSWDYQAPVVINSGDNHEIFFAESNLHACPFLDCILHFTFHIIYCIYSSKLSEISYVCLYGDPASLSRGRGTKPQVADQLFQQILRDFMGRQPQLISSKCFPIHYSKITT